jgi:hypothetical protein
MFEARDVYELQRDLDREIMGHTTLPSWDELSWSEQDAWQVKADEVNDKNMEVSLWAALTDE